MLPSASRSSSAPPAAPQAGAAALQAEIAELKSLLPDQSHAMADVAYHFTNLWFAVQKKNWPLAKYYFDETRAHLEWAVRIKPIRRTSFGEDLNLPGIRDAIDNSFFAEMQKAMEAKSPEAFAAAYRLTIEGCYACRRAAEKPYLKPRIPDEPAAQNINFDPGAAWPQ